MLECTLTRKTVRELDRTAIEEFGIPGIVLMENAGRNAADVLRSTGTIGRVVVCCGKGNNGGDGFVIARHLESHGVAVRTLLFANLSDLTDDAAANCNIVQRAGIPMRVLAGEIDASELDAELRGADWIVDALLGTGSTGVIREPLATVIGRINAAVARIFAVDVPSGLDCDTGEPLGASVRADVTVTFVAKKAGFEGPVARSLLGKVHVVDIGVPRVLLERFGVQQPSETCAG